MQNEIQLKDIADKLNFSLENTHKILDIFYESSSTILNNLENSIQNNDYEMIYRNAHSIKGSSSNLLFNDVYALAKEIESNAKEQIEYPYLEKVHQMRRLIKETKIV